MGGISRTGMAARSIAPVNQANLPSPNPAPGYGYLNSASFNSALAGKSYSPLLQAIAQQGAQTNGAQTYVPNFPANYSAYYDGRK